MASRELITAVTLAEQYLNPSYNQAGDIEAQKYQEKGNINQVMEELAKKDPKVLKVWEAVKEERETRAVIYQQK